MLYGTLRILCVGRDFPLGIRAERKRRKVVISWQDFTQAMQFTAGEEPNLLKDHIMDDLSRHSLIESRWASGPGTFVQTDLGIDGSKVPPRGAVVFSPSPQGIELFLAAHGYRDKEIIDFGNVAIQLEDLAEVTLPDNAYIEELPNNRIESDEE